MTTRETLPDRANCGVFLFVARCTEACFCFTFCYWISVVCPSSDIGDHGQSLKAMWWDFVVPWSSHVHNHQKDQLCQLLEDHLPCSGWRELLGGRNLTTRCGDSCQSAAEGTGLLKGLSSWLWLSGVPFISPNPQDVDCILTAIGFPSACPWCKMFVGKGRQLSHLPTFLHQWQWLMSTWRVALYLWARPLQICLSPPHLNFPDRIRAILKQKQRNKSEHTNKPQSFG